jgi:hypothetical protein
VSQMNRSSHTFACAAIVASLVLSACRSVSPSEPAETVIAVSAFETLGNAQATVAQDMAANLVAALNADPHIRAQLETGDSSASLDYKVKGAVYVEGQRAFVALQLVDAKTTKRVWSENYDYRGIGTDKMAAEIRAYVQGHTAEN